MGRHAPTLAGTPVGGGWWALFGLPLTAFALFWVSGALWATRRTPDFGLPGDGPPFAWAFPLFGLIFVAVGLAMLTAPLWMRWRAGRTVYAVTDRRAVVWEGGLSTTVRSFDADALGDLERRERADGSGDLILARDLRTTSHHGRRGVRTTEVGFFGIPDVRGVERLVRDIA